MAWQQHRLRPGTAPRRARAMRCGASRYKDGHTAPSCKAGKLCPSRPSRFTMNLIHPNRATPATPPADRDQTLGEEIANAISHGLGVLLAIAALPILVTRAVGHG